jgi:hypothetical protein
VSLRSLARRGIQHAEAPVAVGLERAHAEVVGQGEGLAVIVFGLLARQRLAPRRNRAEEAQSICLVAPFLVRTGMRQRTLGQGVCLPPSGQPAAALLLGRNDRTPRRILFPLS